MSQLFVYTFVKGLQYYNMNEQLPAGIEAEIKEFITHEIHAYMRGLLGETVYVALNILLIFLGIAILAGAIMNSNLLLGNPLKRDKSQLNDIQYLKTRRMLRVLLGFLGFILIVYNTLGLIS